MHNFPSPPRRWRAAAALAATATVLAACGGGSSDVAGGGGGPKADTTLTLVAYAVPEPGWSKIIPAFVATPEGKGVEVTTSYGASGDQSRAVVDGKPADIVNFSVEPDVTRLVKANKVGADWNKDATKVRVVSAFGWLPPPATSLEPPPPQAASTVAVAASAAAARHRRGGEGILCIRGLSHCGLRAEVSPSQRIGVFSAENSRDNRRHQTEDGQGCQRQHATSATAQAPTAIRARMWPSR